MRTYLAFKAKAARFKTDPDIAAALAAASVPELGKPTVGQYSAESAKALKAETFDLAALADRGYANERLDQLVVELILGLR
jgi:xylose isomerase